MPYIVIVTNYAGEKIKINSIILQFTYRNIN